MEAFHPFEPFYDADSEKLVLGTMPSPASIKNGFYYGHPRNRFWRIIAEVFNAPFPESIAERRELARAAHIALWDVLASCQIEGASDSTIRAPVCNDISALLAKTKITRVFTTGNKAYSLYSRFCEQKTGIKAIALPSTSPANCAMAQILAERYRALL